MPEPKNTNIAFKTKITTGSAVWRKMKKWGYVIINGWYWWDPLIDHNRSVVAKTVKIKCFDQLLNIKIPFLTNISC
jgi:hypothetical protein